MEEITIAEVVGEVRKGLRLFEAFKEADKIIQFLAQEEKVKLAIEKSVAVGKKAEQDLQDQLDSLEQKIQDKIKEYDTLVAKIAETIKESKMQQLDIVNTANKKAEEIVKKAEIEVSKIISEKNTHESATILAKNELIKVQKTLDLVKAEIKQHKDKVTSLFGNH